MQYQNIVKVEKPQHYLDVAFKKASEKASKVRATKIKGERITKSKRIELIRISAVKDSLVNQLNKILESFPRIDDEPVFYRELIKTTTDYVALKKSLGGMNWAKKKVIEFFNDSNKKIARCKELGKINGYRRGFYGRISSIIKRIGKNLAQLKRAGDIMRSFPDIKPGIFTVCIFGFPNVGKTTLLFKLTGSKPEIKPYAFTTKGLNLGYIKEGYKKIQLIDTPGSLNRFDKMNNIEKQAYLAAKYCANLIIYVYDLTEPYPLKGQDELFENIKKHGKEVLVYLSKTDILDKAVVDKFKNNRNIKDFGVKELKLKLLEKAF